MIARALERELQRRLDRSRQVLDEATRDDTERHPGGQEPASGRRARRQLLALQTAELSRMSQEGAIGRAVHERLQRELDLEEARL